MLSSNFQKSPERNFIAIFKVAALAILEIQVPAIKSAIIAQFR
jgi:hypothetical protein